MDSGGGKTQTLPSLSEASAPGPASGDSDTLEKRQRLTLKGFSPREKESFLRLQEDTALLQQAATCSQTLDQ